MSLRGAYLRDRPGPEVDDALAGLVELDDRPAEVPERRVEPEYDRTADDAHATLASSAPAARLTSTRRTSAPHHQTRRRSKNRFRTSARCRSARKSRIPVPAAHAARCGSRRHAPRAYREAAAVRRRLHGTCTEAVRLAGYRGNEVTLGAVGAENLKKPQIRAPWTLRSARCAPPAKATASEPSSASSRLRWATR